MSVRVSRSVMVRLERGAYKARSRGWVRREALDRRVCGQYPTIFVLAKAGAVVNVHSVRLINVAARTSVGHPRAERQWTGLT